MGSRREEKNRAKIILRNDYYTSIGAGHNKKNIYIALGLNAAQAHELRNLEIVEKSHSWKAAEMVLILHLVTIFGSDWRTNTIILNYVFSLSLAIKQVRLKFYAVRKVCDFDPISHRKLPVLPRGRKTAEVRKEEDARRSEVVMFLRQIGNWITIDRERAVRYILRILPHLGIVTPDQEENEEMSETPHESSENPQVDEDIPNDNAQIGVNEIEDEVVEPIPEESQDNTKPVPGVGNQAPTENPVREGMDQQIIGIILNPLVIPRSLDYEEESE